MGAPRPVLIVDDDHALFRLIAEQFDLSGEFAAVEAASVAETDAQLGCSESQFDAIILDIGLPDGDGRDYCTDLRRRGVKVPIIMLTGSDEESDVIRSLASGANDYVVKPFRPVELLARVRAQLRAFDNSEDAVFTIGPYTFRPSTKLLHDEGRRKRIRLTDKEAAILRFLYRAGAKRVAREVLRDNVWGQAVSVTTHTLETHVFRLRQKIEVHPSHPRLLVTDNGGYRLNAEPASTSRTE